MNTSNINYCWASLMIVFISSFFLVSCERSEETVKQDRQKYARISAERPLGTSCYLADSASVKRREYHPLGPTGGWGRFAEMDTNRQHDTAKNEFFWIAGDIAGYIQYPVSGQLKIRSYDDIYGNVYCGWSPVSVKYTPQAKPVYVVFSRCAVGDGGLDQVHELCWFPENSEKGIVVYSTAHTQNTDLKRHDVFLPRHLGEVSGKVGNEIFYFNDYEADLIFDSLLRVGKLDQAKELVLTNLEGIKYFIGGVDGSTGKPISPFQLHCDSVVKLLLLKAGLNLFDPDSKQSIAMAKKYIIDGKSFCDQRYTLDLIDLYVWAITRVQGGDLLLPQIPDTANRVHGYDPRVIAKLLSDPAITDVSLKKPSFSLGGEVNYFWLGVREYLSSNKEEASRYLALYINNPNHGNDFELAAAVALMAKISGNLEK